MEQAHEGKRGHNTASNCGSEMRPSYEACTSIIFYSPEQMKFIMAAGKRQASGVDHAETGKQKSNRNGFKAYYLVGFYSQSRFREEEDSDWIDI